jgi:predicted transcriptional regulator
MKVKECMSTPIRTVQAEQTIQDAAAAMRQFDVAELAVKKDDAVQGFITDRDIISCCAAEGADPTATTVGQFMRQDVTRCHEDDATEDVGAIMEKAGTRHLLVLNSQEQETGILSLWDLARRQIAGKTANEALTALCPRT